MDDFKGTPGPWHWDEEGLGNKNHIVFGKEYPAEMTSKANSLNPTEDLLFQTEKAIAKALGKE